MDPECSAEAGRWIVVLGRVVIGAVAVAAGIWLVLVGYGAIVDRANALFAWFGGRSPVRWLATRSATAFWISVVTLGLGVLFAAFEMGGDQRKYKRFWYRNPHQVARVLTAWASK